MKKLTSLIIFVGLAFNVSGQEAPNSLKEAMDAAKNHWMMGDWERKRSNEGGFHSKPGTFNLHFPPQCLIQ